MTARLRIHCMAAIAIEVVLVGGVARGAQWVTDTPLASEQQRFVVVGTLVQRGVTRDGLPRYALLDDERRVQTFVAARPDLNLDRFINTQVGVTARSVSLRTDTPYLLADQITPLESLSSVGGPVPLESILVDGGGDVTGSGVQLAGYEMPMTVDEYGIPQPFDNLTPSAAAGTSACPQCGYGLGQTGTGWQIGAVPAPVVPGVSLPPTVPGRAAPSPVAAQQAYAACPCGPIGRIYGRAEYLWWWTKGMSLPPLLTTSPLGTPRATAGVLGQDGTSLVLGGDQILTSVDNGGRFLIGGWIDRCQWIGLEADFFFLTEGSDSFHFSSTGNPILARPFVNVLTGQPSAELVAYPGLVAGSLDVRGTSELQSAAPRLRLNLISQAPTTAPSDLPTGYRLDVLGGYRYMKLSESLRMVENQTTIPGGNGGAVAFINTRDQFETKNTFHGGEIGLEWDGYQGPWSLEVLTRLAFGNSNREVRIQGHTRTTTQGVTVDNSGGLLALSSNIGTYSDDRFSLIPQLDALVGYAVTPQLRLKAGYTLLYWNKVARPGDQIDLGLNPNLFPPPLPDPGAQRPAFALQEKSYWAQGLSVGVDYRW